MPNRPLGSGNYADRLSRSIGTTPDAAPFGGRGMPISSLDARAGAVRAWTFIDQANNIGNGTGGIGTVDIGDAPAASNSPWTVTGVGAIAGTVLQPPAAGDNPNMQVLTSAVDGEGVIVQGVQAIFRLVGARTVGVEYQMSTAAGGGINANNSHWFLGMASTTGAFAMDANGNITGDEFAGWWFQNGTHTRGFPVPIAAGVGGAQETFTSPATSSLDENNVHYGVCIHNVDEVQFSVGRQVFPNGLSMTVGDVEEMTTAWDNTVVMHPSFAIVADQATAHGFALGSIVMAST